MVWSLILLGAVSIAPVEQPSGGHDIYIRSREGKSVSVRQWAIKGALADGRPVLITVNFAKRSKAITVGLAVAGKSWGQKRIDEARFPNVDVHSLGLNQIGSRVQVIFDYGVKPECDKRGDLHPEVTVDFTPKAVELHTGRGYCSK